MLQGSQFQAREIMDQDKVDKRVYEFIHTQSLSYLKPLFI